MVSESAPEQDYREAPLRCARLGVKELWVFDPRGLGPSITGGYKVSTRQAETSLPVDAELAHPRAEGAGVETEPGGGALRSLNLAVYKRENPANMGPDNVIKSERIDRQGRVYSSQGASEVERSLPLAENECPLYYVLELSHIARPGVGFEGPTGSLSPPLRHRPEGDCTLEGQPYPH